MKIVNILDCVLDVSSIDTNKPALNKLINLVYYMYRVFILSGHTLLSIITGAALRASGKCFYTDNTHGTGEHYALY